MKKLFLLILLMPISLFGYTLQDSIRLENIESKLKILQDRVDEVKRDQLNYSIEKDLIKDTYKGNFEKINFFLTAFIAIIGLLGFLGIKDINTIKKEYKEELDKLNKLQTELIAKSKEFEDTKERYDKDIKEIIQQNEIQNRKVKILELKEKIDKLFSEKQYNTALEFTIVALEIAPNEIDLMRKKAQIYTRLRKYDESIKNYIKILEIDSKNETAIFDLTELYLFTNTQEKADELIKNNTELYKTKLDGELLKFFELITLFNNQNESELKSRILTKLDRTDLINRQKRIEGWDVYDALVYVYNAQESSIKNLFLNYLWYLDGQLNAKEILEKIEGNN